MKPINDKIFCAFLVLEAQNVQFYSNFSAGNMGKNRRLSITKRAKIVTLNEEDSLLRKTNFKRTKI